MSNQEIEAQDDLTICGICPICMGSIVEKKQMTLGMYNPLMWASTGGTVTGTMTTAPTTTVTGGTISITGNSTAASGSPYYQYSIPTTTTTTTSYTSYWPPYYFCYDCGVKFEHLPRIKYK